MNWESFYLTCFLVGLLLTIASFVFGTHFHLPHVLHLHFNLAAVLMFLTWFGGAGYVMTHSRSAAAGLAFTVAMVVGFAGGALMYLFMARVFIANEHPLREEDYEMIGLLGHVSSPIRDLGTGEVIYTQQGTRRSCGARSEDGRPIERGTEVVVMRYEKGIAYVRRFEELHAEA
jgi:membrane protein implicated in regulation of membrane protease activity